MANLKNNDYQLIKELLKVTESINELYNKLFLLECNGQENSEEYNKIIEYLNIAIEVEDEIYEKIDISRIEKMYNFLLEHKDIIDNNILKRIVNNITDKFIMDDEWALELLPEELVDEVSDMNNPKKEKELRQFANSFMEVYKCLMKEFSEANLVFLQDYINKNNYSNIRNELIKRKYKLLFTNKKIEFNMIINNFNIPNTIYSNAELTASFALVDQETFKRLKEILFVDKITNEFLKILNGDDINYFCEDIQIYKILKQCLLRAYFVLLDEDVLSELNYEFHQFIEDEFYVKNHSDYKLGEDIIVNSFKNASGDKKKVCVLTLPSK